MATADRTITLDATLRADGTLQFDEPPDLPPGRVRVTLVGPSRPVRTREEIDATVDALRDELENGLRRADRARAEKGGAAGWVEAVRRLGAVPDPVPTPAEAETQLRRAEVAYEDRQRLIDSQTIPCAPPRVGP